MLRISHRPRCNSASHPRLHAWPKTSRGRLHESARSGRDPPAVHSGGDAPRHRGTRMWPPRASVLLRVRPQQRRGAWLMRVERLRALRRRWTARACAGPRPPSSPRKKRPPGATDLRCARAAATSGSEQGSSSSPVCRVCSHTRRPRPPRALSSFAAQLSPRLAEMYGVDFGAFLFDELSRRSIYRTGRSRRNFVPAVRFGWRPKRLLGYI